MLRRWELLGAARQHIDDIRGSIERGHAGGYGQCMRVGEWMNTEGKLYSQKRLISGGNADGR